VSREGAQRSVTEQAWLPMVRFEKDVGAGLATGYVAYDDTHFYFAAKIADNTPDAGTVRMATRDDDASSTPVSYETDPDRRCSGSWRKGKAPDDRPRRRARTGRAVSASYWEDTDTSLSYALDLSLPRTAKPGRAVLRARGENHEDDASASAPTSRIKPRESCSMNGTSGGCGRARTWSGTCPATSESGSARSAMVYRQGAARFFDPANGDDTFVEDDLDTSGDWEGSTARPATRWPVMTPKLPAA
jgi:hypothetical protein